MECCEAEQPTLLMHCQQQLYDVLAKRCLDVRAKRCLDVHAKRCLKLHSSGIHVLPTYVIISVEAM